LRRRAAPRPKTRVALRRIRTLSLPRAALPPARPAPPCHVTAAQEGGTHSVHPRSVRLTLPSDDSREWRSLAPLAAAAAARAAAAGGAAAAELAWQLLAGDEAAAAATSAAAVPAVSTSEVADLLFGDAAAPDALLAAHNLLCSADGSVFFKAAKGGGGGAWEPRGAAAVAQLRASAAASAAAAAARAAFAQALAAAAAAAPADKPPPGSWDDATSAPPGWASWTSALEELALDESEGPPRAAAEEVLAWASGRAQPRPALAALALLVAAGRWSLHENIAARRHRISLSFPPAVTAAAAAAAAATAAAAQPDGTRREDLTHLRAFTVDGADTTEFDDALSVERLPSGRVRVWVHIADATRLVNPGDILDTEALRRGTSVYFPTGSVPMFPHVLAAGPMSLRAAAAHGTSAALSIAAELDGDGSVLDAFIVPSLISVTYRLTYPEADELLRLSLEEEPEWALLAAAAASRHAWRSARGAVSIEMPEASVRVLNATVAGGGADAVVDISCEQTRAPGTGARALVAEMMILAGEVAAGVGAAAGLPLPYRGQLPGVLPSAEELAALPEGPCRAVALRSRMSASSASLVPTPHAALGLSAYVQVTSPIRRYADLLTHWQLKAHISGAPLPFSEADLARRMEAAGAMAAGAQRAARESEKYWVSHYFASQPPGSLYAGTVLRWLREDMGLVALLFEALGLELPVKVYRQVQPGDLVVVECTAARPREGLLQFREKAGASAAGLGAAAGRGYGA
jgi:exoribonuclease-2